MRYAICQELFENWDWERQCRTIAALGYTGIEVAPFTLAPLITDVPIDTLHRLRSQAEGAGLEVIGLHWLLAKTQGLHLTHDDPQVRANTADYLGALARGCAELGGDKLVLGSPLQRSLPAGVSREEGVDRVCEVIGGCIAELATTEVTLCLEPLTPADTNFITSCAEAVEIIDRVRDPHVLLHQDVKAMLSEPQPIPELIRQYAGYLAHFHVNDGNLLGPGMGPTDYHPIFRALREVSYEGWLSVEVFDYRPGAETIARESIEYLRRIEAETR